MAFWRYLIIVGDAAIALPLAVGIALVLLQQRAHARALGWALSFAAAFVVIVVGKASFDFAGWSLPSIGLYSISGHAMLTTAVYPVLFALLAGDRPPAVRRAAVAAGAVLALLMAVVLVAGHYHTVSETVLGGLLGAVVAAWNISRVGATRFVMPYGLIALAGLCAVLLAPTGAARAAKDGLWLRTGEWVGVTERYVRFIERNPHSGGTRIRVIPVPVDAEF
jgi:hypothetical protein